MSREIKVRVWSKELKNFVCPNDVLRLNAYGVLRVIGEKEYVIQQYTGVKDKTGKEIYEGDILVFDKDGQREYGYTVVFSYGKFELKMPDCKMNIDIGWCHEMIVVNKQSVKEMTFV